MAGLAGLATSYFAAMALTIRESPVVAVADEIIRYTPGSLTERAIDALGHNDKPFLIALILLVLTGAFAVRRACSPGGPGGRRPSSSRSCPCSAGGPSCSSAAPRRST